MEMCPRFPLCILRNLGCEKGAEEECDYFNKINSTLASFKEKINAVFSGKGVFLYDDPWYIATVEELLAGLHVNLKEVMSVEDETVDLFFKKGR